MLKIIILGLTFLQLPSLYAMDADFQEYAQRLKSDFNTLQEINNQLRKEISKKEEYILSLKSINDVYLDKQKKLMATIEQLKKEKDESARRYGQTITDLNIAKNTAQAETQIVVYHHNLFANEIHARNYRQAYIIDQVSSSYKNLQHVLLGTLYYINHLERTNLSQEQMALINSIKKLCNENQLEYTIENVASVLVPMPSESRAHFNNPLSSATIQQPPPLP